MDLKKISRDFELVISRNPHRVYGVIAVVAIAALGALVVGLLAHMQVGSMLSQLSKTHTIILLSISGSVLGISLIAGIITRLCIQPVPNSNITILQYTSEEVNTRLSLSDYRFNESSDHRRVFLKASFEHSVFYTYRAEGLSVNSPQFMKVVPLSNKLPDRVAFRLRETLRKERRIQWCTATNTSIFSVLRLLKKHNIRAGLYPLGDASLYPSPINEILPHQSPTEEVLLSENVRDKAISGTSFEVSYEQAYDLARLQCKLADCEKPSDSFYGSTFINAQMKKNGSITEQEKKQWCDEMFALFLMGQLSNKTLEDIKNRFQGLSDANNLHFLVDWVSTQMPENNPDMPTHMVLASTSEGLDLYAQATNSVDKYTIPYQQLDSKKAILFGEGGIDVIIASEPMHEHISRELTQLGITDIVIITPKQAREVISACYGREIQQWMVNNGVRRLW